MVVVPKKGCKWRVCVDYINLNEACSKDSFPLLRIDQIVDASTGHGMLSSLDAFSRYHQIPMHPPDADKMAYIAPHGLYCYNVMLFSLKNVGAAYQRLVTKIFRPLMGKTRKYTSTICFSNPKNAPITRNTWKKPLNCCALTICKSIP